MTNNKSVDLFKSPALNRMDKVKAEDPFKALTKFSTGHIHQLTDRAAVREIFITALRDRVRLTNQGFYEEAESVKDVKRMRKLMKLVDSLLEEHLK